MADHDEQQHVQGYGRVEVEARYRRQVARACGFLTLRGYPERDPRLTAVPLERIFIKLSTMTTRMSVFDELEIRWGPMQEKVRVLRQERSGSRAIITDRELTDQETEELLLYYDREVEKLRKPQTITLSVPEALRDHDRLVVTGPPGSGKTTLLRWLALTFAEGKQAQPDRLGDAYTHERLPVLVELRKFQGRFASEGERLTTVNLADEIAAFVAKDARFEGTPPEFIRQALTDGDCLVAFDGLDEIADFTARQRASAAVQAFADNYAPLGNHIIVTSRPAGYKGVELGAGFQHCDINPFIPKDVSEFIHQWYEAAYLFDPTTAQEEADQLVRDIEGNVRVAKLAETPLLCTIIAIVYRNNRILPNRRVELYLQCCQALLDTWERVKEIRQSGLIGGFDWQTKLELLAPLAYWLHSEKGRTAAPQAEFERRLAAELRERRLCEEPRAEQEARAFLNAVCERSGLLQGRGDGTLEFPHLTFQEYLAARCIAAAPNMESRLDMFMPHLHEAWWREVHLLTIGHLGSGSDGAPKASALLEAILDRYKPPLRLLQAFPHRGGLFGSLRNLPARAFPRWQLVRRLAWAIQRERFFAATGLGDCAPLGVTNEGRDRVRASLEGTLLLAMTNARWAGRGAPLLTLAASSLVELGQASPEVIAALVSALGDSEGYVRRAASSSLGQLGQASPEVIAALVTALGDSDSAVRQAAASSLGQLGQASPEVIGALVSALGDSSGYVRWAAASSLVQLGQGSPEVIGALVSALGDSRRYVQRAAASSLVQLGQGSPEVIGALVSALGDSEWDVRRVAASSLGQLGQASPEVIGALVSALGDSEWDVRRVAASSLGQLGQGSPEVIGALVSALGDSEGYVRRAAALSLVQLGQASPEVIAALVTALGDSDSDVRWAAALSLGQLGQASPEVIAVLVTALGDSEGCVRRAAALSLGQSGQARPQVIAALVSDLGDSDSDVRWAAASRLVQLGQASPEVIAALVSALGDSEGYVRRAAASSLGQLGQASPEVIAVLVSALGDSEGYVRWAAASSLVQLGQASPEVIAVLVTALGDGEWYVRRAAASSLGQLGQASPEVIAVLVTALGDSEGYVRWAAASSLVQLGQASPEVVAALVSALGDGEWYVRRAAASSLGQLGQANSKVLAGLNRALHDSDTGVRNAAHEGLTKLLEGKPVPGDEWRSLKERRERQERRLRWAALILAMVLPPLAYILAILYLPGFRANAWMLAAFAAWAAFLGALAKIQGWWGDSRR